MFKLICFLLVIHIHFATPSLSPVLIWGAECPAKPALRIVQIGEFSDVVGMLLAEHMLVVLQEEHLEASDLLCRKRNSTSSCYKFWESVTPKTYYAMVEEPMEALTYRNVTIVKHNVHGSHCLNCKAACEVGTIQLLKFIVNNTVPHEVNLKMHDAFIRRLQTKYPKDCPIAYMYMSASTSTELITENDQMSLMERVRPIRTPDDMKAMRSGRVLIFANKFYWSNDPGGLDFKVFSLDMRENNSKIQVGVYADGSIFEFHIEVKKSSYAVTKVLYDGAVYLVHNVNAPMNYSYYCDTFKAYGKDRILNIQTFQLEVSHNTEELDKFSKPWRCDGLFSSSLLMTYFSTIILVGILFLGICMIMDIKANDKMDDRDKPRLFIHVQ